MRQTVRMLLLIMLFTIGIVAYPIFVPPAPPSSGSGDSIVINKAINRLYYYRDGKFQRHYPVATGREPDLTPEGDFRVVTKLANNDGLGEENVFGTRWMGLDVPGHEDGTKYGIHGTNEPDSIGKHASAGCIHMSKADVEDLYVKVSSGTVVRIIPGTIIHRSIRQLLPDRSG